MGHDTHESRPTHSDQSHESHAAKAPDAASNLRAEAYAAPSNHQEAPAAAHQANNSPEANSMLKGFDISNQTSGGVNAAKGDAGAKTDAGTKTDAGVKQQTEVPGTTKTDAGPGTPKTDAGAQRPTEVPGAAKTDATVKQQTEVPGTAKTDAGVTQQSEVPGTVKTDAGAKQQLDVPSNGQQSTESPTIARRPVDTQMASLAIRNLYSRQSSPSQIQLRSLRLQINQSRTN